MGPKRHIVIHQIDNGFMLVVGLAGAPCNPKEIYCSSIAEVAEVIEDVVESFDKETKERFAIPAQAAQAEAQAFDEQMKAQGPVLEALESLNVSDGVASNQEASPQAD